MLLSDFLGCKSIMFHGKKWKNEVSQQKNGNGNKCTNGIQVKLQPTQLKKLLSI